MVRTHITRSDWWICCWLIICINLTHQLLGKPTHNITKFYFGADLQFTRLHLQNGLVSMILHSDWPQANATVNRGYVCGTVYIHSVGKGCKIFLEFVGKLNDLQYKQISATYLLKMQSK